MLTENFCYQTNAVFEYRNHEYGAFVLRERYEHRILTAASAAIIFFTSVLIAPVIYARLNPKDGNLEKNKEKVIVLTNVAPEETKPLPPIPPPPIQKPNVAIIKCFFPEPAPDHIAKDEMPTQDDMKGKVIGEIDQDGEPTDDFNEIISENKEVIKETGLDTDKDEPPIIVEQMPEFSGGLKGLMQYLAGNIKYPKQAVRIGTEGRVYVSFVIGKDGKISDIKLTKGIGAGCDEEAVRVIASMPDWTPGKQNGRPVSVRYSLPVTFQLEK
jgi:protein TonB